MDILNAYHGLSQAFFPTSAADNASAFSLSSVNEKPLHIPSTYLKDPRTQLAALCALSLLILLADYIVRPIISTYIKSRRAQAQSYEPVLAARSTESEAGVNPAEESTKGKGFLESNGGWQIFTWGVLRLAGLIVFEILTVLAVLNAGRRKEKLVETTLAAVFGYLITLSVLSLTFRPSMASSLTFAFKLHIIGILLVTWFVFARRDIYPMITFTIRPADKLDMPMWTRLGVLTFIALLPPLFTPRPYVPINSASPKQPTHEQTSCLFSLTFFTFLDPIIFYAWKRPSLGIEDLPHLADIDSAQNLRDQMLHLLDPQSKDPRAFKGYVHLGWRICYAWWKELLACIALSAAYATMQFASVLGVNRLLTYLETNGEGAIIKPWVWVCWIGLGPFFQGLAFNVLIYVSVRFMVRCESILSQVLFEHSLRIQLREDGKKPKEGEKPDDQAPGGNLVGRINNLISSDLDSLIQFRVLPIDGIAAPLGLAISVTGLYKILGWSAFVGIASLIATTPLPAKMTVLQHGTQKKFMQAADARVQKVTEAINALRITKMFGLESQVKNEISELRAKELYLNRKRKLLSLAMSICNYSLPLLVMVITFGSYTTLQGGTLTSAKVFSAISVFAIFSNSLSTFFQIARYIEANVSLQRINKFLHDTQLIDRYLPETSDVVNEDPNYIGFKNATFGWTRDADETDENARNFKLVIDDLRFRKGAVNLVAGPTGSGKTSLLLALLGEMHFEAAPGSSFSLPRQGGVSFADQQSWLQNATLRENILFGTPYDEERYRKVVHQCALERDFSLFDAHDSTEVGEKGLSLSGGQKARITLARAVYAHSDILLLDDILSALDVQTARWICEKCLRGDIVRGRTVILVTHHIAMASSSAEFLVSLQDGRVKTSGSINETLKADPKLFVEEKTDEGNEEIANDVDAVEGPPGDEKPARPVSDGKLILAEEKAQGRVSRQAIQLLVNSLGGFWFWTVVLVGLVIDQAFVLSQTWWLGQWSRQYSLHDSKDVSVAYYLLIYCLAVLLGTAAMSAGFTVWQYGAVRSGAAIHKRLLDSVFASTLRFLDVTPQGRIIQRFTKDVRVIDGEFTELTSTVLDMAITLLVKLAAIAFIVPWFSLGGLAVAVFGGLLAELYIHAQLSCKREMSIYKGPLFSHFGDAIQGLISVRAYGAEEKVRAEAIRRVDRYIRTTVIFYNLNRWCNVRFDTLAAMFSSSLAFYLVYGPEKRDAAEIGFTLAVSVQFSSLLLWFFRIYNMWEVAGNSVERVQEYLDPVPKEKEASPSGVPPAYWPSSGDISISDLSARYSADGPVVLNHLNLTIKSGERIGVVGRTGSGKSTFALAMLRLIPLEGDIFIDGKNTADLNLDALRRSMTIIPQDPTLYSGTLRSNLDPYGELEDAVLERAMKSCGLSETHASAGPSNGASTPHAITLKTDIAAGGENLSQGQKQLVALARGLVRRSKIYILDEATASVDFENDSRIQTAIRAELVGCTLITIAHRLRSIMDYDRILLLDGGKLVEFDTPKNLLAKPESHLSTLVAASADAEELRAIANEKI